MMCKFISLITNQISDIALWKGLLTDFTFWFTGLSLPEDFGLLLCTHIYKEGCAIEPKFAHHTQKLYSLYSVIMQMHFQYGDDEKIYIKLKSKTKSYPS